MTAGLIHRRNAAVFAGWLGLSLWLGPGGAAARPDELKANLSFKQSASRVEVFDFVEVEARVARPTAVNPFTDVVVRAEFRREGAAALPVEGFCDAADGSVYRVRFMPAQAGRHSYTVRFQQGAAETTFTGSFVARQGRRRGPVRVDRAHPFHFVYEGSGEHYFWNSTTTYALIGWKEDAQIERILDRLQRWKVNRIRAALIPPRVRGGQQWFEPMVTNCAAFDFRVNAWPAARPDDFENPGFDTSRFDVAHFQKYERLLRAARERNLIVSVIFYVDGRLPGVDPFKKAGQGGHWEQMYYRYSVARFAAFANVMWDVANEYRLFRDDAWAERMGALIKDCDPYDHLTSTHGHGDFRFRTSAWADLALYQSWDEHGGYQYMLNNRRKQVKTGRIIPQVNEEYGYEEHYPQGWGESRKPPARSADNRRRLAWEITMAGGYQTTGERADRGAGAGPDTGGGWINGRGDETMVLLKYHGHLCDFFTCVPWWTTEPRPELVSSNACCLACPGRLYLIYLPKGGRATLRLEPGRYSARWFNPRTGAFSRLPDATGPEWTSPGTADAQDWALVLQARDP
jgi:hypothetical protein